MESAEELQQQEITALQSIYAEDFKESPPPKAWRSAARLPEFIIKVPYPDLQHATKVYFHLHTKFPKTYPHLACPTFAIQGPISGLTNDHVTRLSAAIHAEAQKHRGSEMVFQIITFSQEWLESNLKPAVENPGSLATEMDRRASEAERERQHFLAAEAEREAHLAAQLAEQFQAESTAQLQKQRKKHEDHKQRHRAWSDATEMPLDVAGGDMVVEGFGSLVEFGGIAFSSVKIFHPRKEFLGMTYLADPVCDDVHATLPLEVHIVTFISGYYSTSQGRKKLKQVEAEISRLSTISHPNLLRVLAVKLSLPHGNGAGPARLVILSEERPSLSLEDVLEDSECLRENKATNYLAQCLSALHAIHAGDLVHRGLTARCIGLAPHDSSASTPSRIVKVGKAGYHTRLLDLHRSNPFGPNLGLENDTPVPETWLSKDVIDSPLMYTKGRDLHCLGVVLLQMLIGKDVIERFPDGVHSALRASSISPALQQHATNMLLPTKKAHASCLGLLADLSEMSLRSGTPQQGRSRAQSIAVPGPKTPKASNFHNYSSSPENDYFRAPPRTRQASRWKEDWEELELLGKGAFGSVVKARNKIDSRIYAVKKVKLKTNQSDNKIFREVNALSRLSHRFIVRYYTTWVETFEPISTAVSSGSTSETEVTDTEEDNGMTSVPHSSRSESAEEIHPSGFNGRFSIDLNDLDDMGGSGTQASFPSIHFGGSASSDEKGSDEDDSDNSGDPFGNLFSREGSADLVEIRRHRPKTPPVIARTLYIQMEFVERQTLKERVAEGISEDEAWRLFQQILDALVHMSSLGILHRDIKLTNIFIDGKGDCKVGDFGLATSSLAAVDPSDVSPILTPDADMTLEVGTTLYIAPEVQSRKRGPRNHTKADMYSLGIVFFEMNFFFSTASERIAVIEDLRKPDIFFPAGWQPHLTRQKQIITSLLQHDPADRPTALELSQSSLLPPRLEDEYFRGALRMMTKHDSPHHQAVLSSLFNQPPNQVRGFLYDAEAELPEHASLNDIVQDRVASIFRLHGAVDMEPSLLMPIMNETEQNQAVFLDRHGDVVMLPSNALVPFARLAARGNIKRIKRYHIADIYRPSAVTGHPRVSKAAVFDIITPDLTNGPIAASAEVLALVNDFLHSFPTLADNYEVHISHSKIVSLALNRIPNDLRPTVFDIINQSKSSPSQKRALLLKKGLLRSTADELEILAEVDDDIDALIARLEKISPTFLSLISSAVIEIKKTIEYATTAGFTSTVFFHPLMWGQHHTHFKDSVRIEVVRRSKRLDVLAAAGRYDALISKLAAPKIKAENTPICAVGMQINLDKITVALAAYQSLSVKTLIKEQRSFGFWSPRRCDVYVVSYHPGYLQDRLEVASLLWQNNISADVMYESGLPDTDQENQELCSREGILFTVYPRPRTGRRDQPAFKVKSILKGTEYEVSRQELVSHLHQQIAEQKRVDLSTSGISIQSDIHLSSTVLSTKDAPASSDVQLLLPGDTKKQRKQVKQIFLDRAYDTGVQIKTAVQSGMPILAVDVPTSLFDAMMKTTIWITDDEAWRAIVGSVAPSHSAYAWQVRETVGKKKADGYPFLLLFAVREERVHLLTLS